MSKGAFPTAQAAKAAGWYSRRNKTWEAQDAARKAYQADHGPAARKRKAAERLAAEATVR